MILETSLQAQFLGPVAVALGFGVLFASLVTLPVVPGGYVVLDDLRRGALRRHAICTGDRLATDPETSRRPA